jgi:hypothetical protein
MMSDASGPAATIGAEGYLTGYPLSESGHYALARTWPAPELPRPGCVWTHTILIDFSDIPSLRSASAILKLFRRPQADEQSYGESVEHESTTDDDRPEISDDLARRILYAVYGNPTKPIVSAAADVPTRDALVLAIWDQQWPRLRRAFRFCTLSFADRSSTNATFDLQFLPSAGRVRPTQFKSALNADWQDFVATDWLENAVTDLKKGLDGRLRRFLRVAGSDVGGRESFEPLAVLHTLSLHFDADPTAIERAISLLEGTISMAQGHTARSLLVQAAAAAADRLGADGLKFVVRNFGLIEPAESNAAAERVGQALWRIEPKVVFDIRSDPERSAIAERAIASMPPASLLEGIASAPTHLFDLLGSRPDLATESAFWSLEGATRPDILQLVQSSSDLIDGAVNAMIRSGRPLVREACATFGSDRVLRRVLASAGDPVMEDGIRSAWLTATASDTDAVAHILVEDWINDIETLQVIARVVTPDAIPNAYGDDPWLVAVKRVSTPLTSLYLASFLLVRALGRRTTNNVELVQATFDIVYSAAEKRTLPDDAWKILDRRLDRSWWWHDWDKCIRIRHTVASLYLDRGIDALAFVRITGRDDVFAELIGALSEKLGSQRYLKAIRNRMRDAGIGGERLRMVKHAIMW